MYRAEVKLNTLSNTDRAGAKYQDFFLIWCGNCFILCSFITVYRIVIRSGSSKFCGTGINHLVSGFDTSLCAESFDFLFCFACKAGDNVVRELHTFCFQKKLFGKFSGLQGIFHSNKDCQLVNEPDVDLGNVMKHGLRHTTADCFCNLPDSAVVHDCQLIQQFLICKLCKIVGHQAVYMLLQGTDCFHKSTLKVMADTHNLTSSFHLSGKGSLSCDKFIKWKSRNLNDTVVKHRLETCVCFSSDGIRDLIQCISKCDLRCNLRDRVTSCLTCKCRGTAYTRVNLDNTVFEAVWFQCVLNVTSTCDSKLCDNVQGRGTEHLVLFVPKSLGRSNYDGVSCVDTNRVNVLHVADSDAVSCTVTHYLILDFFPAGDAALYQNLSNTGKTKTILQDLTKLVFIVGNSTAASAKGVSRTKNNRIANGIGKCKTILHRGNNLGSCNRLADFLHSIFKFLTILSLLDSLGCSTDQSYIMLFQEAFLIQLHGKVQTCLATQSRKNAVWLLFQDQLLYHFYSKRLDVNAVCNVFICHDCSRIGVQKNNLQTFFFQGTAGLCSCVVKLCCLADDDRT